MDVLIVLFLVFVAAPFALLMWMPGWKSFTVAAVVLLGLWINFALSPSHTTGFGQGMARAFSDLLTYALGASVLGGIGIKAALLSRRKRGIKEAQ
ncbi:hypothetical protein NR756_06610 [Alloalcanivorax xenomutans]|uniref:hypothetical protein n=1 Tax=Alloalcanivorax xenomutans TaxID=1094342 RepID=UPI003A80B345